MDTTEQDKDLAGNETAQKRFRKKNFSIEETEALIQAVRDQSGILFGKSSPLKRQRAWNEVAQDVSAVSVCGRTGSECKIKWKQYKKFAKTKRNIQVTPPIYKPIDAELNVYIYEDKEIQTDLDSRLPVQPETKPPMPESNKLLQQGEDLLQNTKRIGDELHDIKHYLKMIAESLMKRNET